MNKTEYRITLGVILITGILICYQIFQHSGIAWDEPAQRLNNGKVNFQAILELNPKSLLQEPEKYHGPAFEIILYGIEKLVNPSREIEAYHLRHFISWLFFLMGGAAFYFFLREKKIGTYWSLAGLVLYIFFPRLWGESIYNSKDVPPLSDLSFLLLFGQRYFQSRKFYYLILTALAAGMGISTRLPMALFVFLFWVIQVFTSKKGKSFILFFPLLTLLFTIITWPVLWNNPIEHGISAFQEMTAYPWTGHVLYLDKIYPGNQLPWHYLLVWILASVPLTVLLGIGAWGIHIIRKKKIEPISLLCMTYALILLLYLSLGNSTLYDGWRHIYFIYPGLVYLCVMAGVTYFPAGLKPGWLSAYTLGMSVQILWLGVFCYTWENIPGRLTRYIASREFEYWGISASNYAINAQDTCFDSHRVWALNRSTNNGTFSNPETSWMGLASLQNFLCRDIWYHENKKPDWFFFRHLPYSTTYIPHKITPKKNLYSSGPFKLDSAKEFSPAYLQIENSLFRSGLPLKKIKGQLSTHDTLWLVCTYQQENTTIWWYGEPLTHGFFDREIFLPHLGKDSLTFKVYIWNAKKLNAGGYFNVYP